MDDARRDHDEARTLYELLQDQVSPLFYRRGDMGYSPEWLAMAKHSIASLLPRFSSTRMVGEYLAKFYLPATRQGRRYAESGYDNAKAGALKAQVRRNWDNVRLRRLDTPSKNWLGEGVKVELGVHLNGLSPKTWWWSCSTRQEKRELRDVRHYRFEWEGCDDRPGEHRFAPDHAGNAASSHAFAYPYHRF
jgi:starch phosphorylase